MESSKATNPAGAGSRSRRKSSSRKQKNGKSIVVIEEIPYGVIRKSIVESVAECVKKDLINGHFRDQR